MLSNFSPFNFGHLNTSQVHGGTTAADIKDAVERANKQANINNRICDEFGAEWRKARTDKQEKEMKASIIVDLE